MLLCGAALGFEGLNLLAREDSDPLVVRGEVACVTVGLFFSSVGFALSGVSLSSLLDKDSRTDYQELEHNMEDIMF